MIQYDSNKDRSEEFGWKKVKDEKRPTEQEQNRWGKILVIFSLLLIATVFLLRN
jgi:hypothetical protein